MLSSTSTRCLFLFVALAVLVPAQAVTADAKRPLSLPQRQLRLDLAPPDYGFMDHGWLNDNRGLRIAKPANGDVGALIGLGGGYGITSDFEAGALLLPFVFAPDTDVGDLELYGRYTFLQGPGSVAFQLTLQLPTQTEFGLGLGLPFFVELSPQLRLEGGVELEIIFDVDVFNIDVPLAFNYYFSPQGFAGVRTGLLMIDTDEAAFNLGVQGGFEVASDIVLSGGLNFPYFLWTGPGDALNLDIFELIFGANFYFGT